MATLDLDDLPPKIARMILGLGEGEALLVVQHGAVMRRLIAQTQPPGGAVVAAEPEAEAAPEPPVEPISSPVTEQKTREIFETFRAAIEDEF